MSKLRKGDTIKCEDENEVRAMLKKLGEDGYNAVTWDFYKHIIKITKEPGGPDG